MKKVSNIVMMLIGMAIGVCLGIGMVAMIDRLPDMPAGRMLALYALALVMLFALLPVELIAHEAGHLLFGLLTGWRFVSFRVGNILWVRGADGRVTRAKYSLAGTAGQCLMAPPPYQEQGFPCALYNLGGVIVNLATALVCGLLAWALWDHPVAALLLAEAGGVGLLLGLSNGIPIPGMMVANDGSNLMSVLNSRDASRALWIQMSLAAAQAEGVRLSDMPDEWFAPFPESSMGNPLVASVAVFAANRQLDAIDLSGAEDAIRALVARKTGVLPLHRALLILDGACCELLAGRPADLTEGLAEPAVQQVMKAMKSNVSVLRAQYIIALLRDRDEGKAASLKEAFDKAAESWPYRQDLIAERALMALADHTPQEG